MIEVRSVKKYFKDIRAVDGIDLKIGVGEFVALLGPNGAGKTTLVEMIEGIQSPDSGQIFIEGKRWKGNESYLHSIIGLSLQETRFIDKLTIYETLKLFASFYGLPEKRVKKVLELVRLEEKHKSFVVHLSGGQRQRLALGISLLNNPKVLLLDEPTTGLDPTARREIWNILLDLKKETNTSLLLTTHYMEEAEFLCERIVIVHSGKVLAKGTLDELLSKNMPGQLIEFSMGFQDEKISPLKLINGMPINWDSSGVKGKVFSDNVQTDLYELLKYTESKNIKLDSLVCRKTTLDDLFISMTGERLMD